jgi:hypothetical protein
MKRIGDERAVCECERCSESSVDFGERDGLRRRRRAVKLGQLCERALIGRERQSKRHAPVSRDRPRWLRSAVREPASVGSAAEVIRLCSREGCVQFRQNMCRPFSGRFTRRRAWISLNDLNPQRREPCRSRLEEPHDHGHLPRHWPLAGYLQRHSCSWFWPQEPLRDPPPPNLVASEPDSPPRFQSRISPRG